MVKISRVLKLCNGNPLIICFVVVFLIIVYTALKLGEPINDEGVEKCTYDEPIDVVYTWVNGSDPLFISDMNKYLNSKENVDSSKHRYEDKNELRFSLRSLEKYVPWINHIYLVTNGQIPYWLNLEYDKITLVTHEEIFRDKSNLPTFSSPAIESNLHRIPGLSRQFIYFNDDIFIGQPLYLDDFYSISKGYLIYLSYVLPNCVSNCPWLYVGDGQCDWNCNVEKCQFDGGDCREKDSGQMTFSEELNSQESQNSKINQQNVRSLIQRNNNSASLNLNINSFLKRSYIENNAFKNIKFDQHLTQTSNILLSDLVKQHNKNILLQNKKQNRQKRNQFKDKSHSNKSAIRNIDGFLESLQYTQRLFNRKFGFKSRNVPAHAPIFINRDIMRKLENTFLTEFELTERNRFRHNHDVQFGFSYYYFLMSEKIERSVENIFDDIDTDNSGTWSDREIRNLLTRIYELPLSYEIVDHFEGLLLNCSEVGKYSEVNTPPYERYIDSKLPTISKQLISQCAFLREFLKKKFGHIPKHKYRIIKDTEGSFSTFKMLISNLTNVVIHLDEVRRRLTKFVCLNDNLDESKPTENDLIRAILYDFYLSLFPHPSKFELPEHSRNRFLHMKDLEEWRRHHFIVKTALSLAILSLLLLTFFNALKKCFSKIINELFC